MRLINTASWEHELLKEAPVRLELDSIILPDNTELTFVGIEHGEESSADYLKDILRDTDIFFPELNSWDPLTAKYLQKVSNGDYKARQRMLEGSQGNFMSFVGTMVKGLYNTRVNVRMADLPRTSPIPAKLSRTGYDNNGGLTSAAFSLMAERDKHIAHTIGPEIIQAQNENSRLKDKLVKATAIFGIGHIGVEAALREAARIQGAGTFSMHLLFDLDAAENRSQDVINYNNWLRTVDKPDTTAEDDVS